MNISHVNIKGFRNFSNVEFDLSSNTLIVGGNDTGKSNLLYALRILFDPSLSSRDLELCDADYNSQSKANKIYIEARIDGITENCVIATIGKEIKNGSAYFVYTIERGKPFQIGVGPSNKPESLSLDLGRSYTRALAIEYVSSSRNLDSFLQHNQRRLLRTSQDARNDADVKADENRLASIQDKLNELNGEISSLSYVEKSLAAVNEEMSRLSTAGSNHTARLVAGNTDATKLINNLDLAYLDGNSPLAFGGDGRGNQLYFATWMSERKTERYARRFVIYVIEEPEAHLHPHQQRLLADYLAKNTAGQFLMTTHSPQIVESFTSGSILRLAGRPDGSSAVFGCSVEIDEALAKFGYRLNQISSEAFFASGVILVEGPSERLFYKALGTDLGLDLDTMNVSVISVDGVGFEPYVRVLTNLGIPFCLRTDNDIEKIPHRDEWHFAGVERAAMIAMAYFADDTEMVNTINNGLPMMRWSGHRNPNKETKEIADGIKSVLKTKGIFLSKKDLESDLANSPIKMNLITHYKLSEQDKPNTLVRRMQERKAENMRDFLLGSTDLKLLADDYLALPLKYIRMLFSDSVDS